MSEKQIRNPHWLEDLIFTRDGGIALNTKTFFKRPEVKRIHKKAHEVAQRAIALRQARLAREQNGGSAAE